MGVNLLGERSLRRLRGLAGDVFIDHAWVLSHSSYWLVQFVTSDHRYGTYNRLTEELVYFGPDDERCFASCERFGDHAQRRQAHFVRDQFARLRQRVKGP